MTISLIIILLVGALILAFNYPSLLAMDTRMAELLRGNDILSIFHFLGDGRFTITMLILTVIILLYKKMGYRILIFVLLNYGLMFVVNRLLKSAIQRPRPELVDQLLSYSMPSGHTMASLTFALVTAYLWRMYVKKWSVSISVILIGSAVLCGLSRIADERHFFTDVIVGWVLSGIIYYIVTKWYEKETATIGSKERQQ